MRKIVGLMDGNDDLVDPGEIPRPAPSCAPLTEHHGDYRLLPAHTPAQARRKNHKGGPSNAGSGGTQSLMNSGAFLFLGNVSGQH